MNPLLLSIITINYNNYYGLQKTIQSVINQNCKNFEYIVIDGGSMDQSEVLLEEYKDFISYSVSETDKGIYNAMNKGINRAKGKYILFLNSGDVLYENNVIEKIEDYLYNDFDFICGNLHYIENGKTFIRKHPEVLTFSYIVSKTISHPSTFIKKEMFEVYGLYNEQNRIVSDWEFFFKALGLNGASYHSINVTITNFDMTGISSTNYKMVEDEKKSVVNKYLPTIFNNENDSYIFNKFIESNKRIKLLKEIDNSPFIRKLTTFLLIFLYKIMKLFKL
ncbi:glycosyltransferase family 2 protein [Flavobacterium sp. HNIBRBA15423]|uniref:glycosyltransferase family 2 protein n=1 Tax=Flavobacterium sp. HNIBRBA15423 TaxID=3458683 RepID=UPI004043FE98